MKHHELDNFRVVPYDLDKASFSGTTVKIGSWNRNEKRFQVYPCDANGSAGASQPMLVKLTNLVLGDNDKKSHDVIVILNAVL